ncbi:Oidioi.mRNA.OKI2018_I69.chr1.g2320.t1.cds [Oikopleura dioica]|uniref:Oidioi.mRNA.OKI2018_I69.chr1.g2320.t1.cds n=1 Tax=Oikopleura dioica TaxID=34765 RepID=A0ABN7SV16_OIKDI|nr:Oidioi.mRNA.OKI2018_I69.chr1.g2320.t1.cds [Oikopleura dioica]
MSQLSLANEFEELDCTQDHQFPRSVEASHEVSTSRKRSSKRQRSSSYQRTEQSVETIDLTMDESSSSDSGTATPVEVATPEERTSPEEPKLIKKMIDFVDSKAWLEDVSAPVAKKTEAEKEWVIEAIVNHRYVENEIKYLIKWKNWPSSSNSWEPLEHMNCNIMIEEYHQKHRAKAEEFNKHFSRRQEDTGFGRNMKPERILGFSDEYADLTILIKWKPNKNQKQANENDDESAQRLNKEELKDPLIIGCIRKDYENYFVLKKKYDTSSDRFLVRTTDAYQLYKKAVFVYFERNLVRDWPEVPKEEE